MKKRRWRTSVVRKGIMESQRAQPQENFQVIAELAPLVHASSACCGTGTEGQDLQGHAEEHADFARRVVELGLLDPGHGLLLTTGGGNGKGHGRRDQPIIRRITPPRKTTTARYGSTIPNSQGSIGDPTQAIRASTSTASNDSM
jgi:hypothetical protein